MRMKIKWTSLSASLSLQQPVHQSFRVAATLIAALQTMSMITTESSDLHQLCKWSDLSTFAPSAFSVFLGTAFTLFIATVLIFKLLTCEQRVVPRDNDLIDHNLNKIFSYAGVISKYIIPVPLIRGCLMEMTNPINSGFQVLSGITLAVFLSFVYPALLILDQGTLFLKTTTNRTLTFFNSELVFNIFRLVIAVSSVVNTTLTVITSTVFFLLFLLAIIKTPIFYYTFQKIKKAFLSAAAFSYLFRLGHLVFSIEEENVFIEIFAAISFSACIQVISKIRVKHILGQGEEKSVYQTKLLLFMAVNLEDYFGELSDFLLKHNKKCELPSCACKKVIEHLADKTSDLAQDSVWFQFIAGSIANAYDLKVLRELPKSEMETKLEEYSQLVFDLAEVLLFKLGRTNRAFLLLTDFREYLEEHSLSHLWNPLRFSVLSYHIQKAVRDKKEVHVQANLFADVQAEMGGYLRLLLRTAEKSEAFWKELGSLEPDPESLLGLIQSIGRGNDSIRRRYTEVRKSFESAQVLDSIVRDYFEEVLNVGAEERGLHVISLPQESRERKGGQRLDEIMRIFSPDSPTPMFLVSVEEQTFGSISQANRAFQELMTTRLGRVKSLDDLILPEMRESHRLLMREAVFSDRVSLEHREGFFLDSNSCLLSAELLTQILPSLEEGLKYAVFLKSLFPKRMLLAVSNNSEISYRSASFEESSNNQDFETFLLNVFLQHNFWQDLQQNMFLTTMQGEQAYLNLLNPQRDTQNKLHFLQILQKNYKEDYICGDHHEMGSMNKLNLSRQNKTSCIGKTITMKYFNCVGDNENQEYLSKKIEKNLKDMFSSFLDRLRGRKIRKSINLLSFSLGIVLLALLVSCLVLKKSDRTYYNSIFACSQSFEALMKKIGQVSVQLKLINLYNTQNINSSKIYEDMKKTSNFFQLFNEAISLFIDNGQINEISLNWTTLTLNPNKTFIPGSEKILHAVPDLLQNPLSNLQSSDLNNFTFPFSLDYLTPPLTSTQVYFHTFITNALYFAIPYFQDFRITTMKNFFDKKFKRITPIVIICPCIMVVVLVGLLFFIICHRKIINLNKHSIELLEKLKGETVSIKIKKCAFFIKKYGLVAETEQMKSSSMDFHQLRYKKRLGLEHNSKNKTDLTSQKQEPTCSNLIIQSDRERRLEQSDGGGVEVERSRRKEEIIFKRQTLTCLIFIYLICSLPFLTFSGVFIYAQISENNAIKTSLEIVYGSGMLQSDFTLIELYALHFGVYNYQLEEYLSIGTYLARLIYQNYYIVQLILTNVMELTSSKALKSLEKIQYANLCQLQQEGLFNSSTLNFEGRWNYTQCVSISGGILTKGLVSTFLHYLDKANNLFLQNKYTIMYPPALKLEYLNNSFFTDTARILNYLNMILENSIDLGREDYQEVLDYFSMLLLASSLALILAILTLLLFLRRHYIKTINYRVNEICTIFSLISFRTVIEDNQMKTYFSEKAEELNDLK